MTDDPKGFADNPLTRAMVKSLEQLDEPRPNCERCGKPKVWSGAMVVTVAFNTDEVPEQQPLSFVCRDCFWQEAE